MYQSTRTKPRTILRRLAKQLAVATVATALMFAGVAPAAAAPEDDLDALVTHAEALFSTGDYTALTRDNLFYSIINARAVLSAGTDASEASILAAHAQLNDDIGKLVDLAALRSTYNNAVKAGDYTAWSWNWHQPSLDAAANLLSHAHDSHFVTTQLEVDTIAATLIGSERLLVDVSGLRAAYDAAPRAGDYTANSWADFKGSFDIAGEALALALTPGWGESQLFIDLYKAGLTTGQSNLVDLSALRAAHSDALTLTSDGHLNHSWSLFAAARDHAGVVLDDAGATNADVAGALQDLTDARHALAFNMGLHDVLVDAALKDETLYGAATWARFAVAVAVLEDLAARDLAGDPVTESEVSAALNVYYPAMYGLLEMAPLRAASEDFASLTANHFARVAFTELAAIAAGVDRVITDSGDPAKIGVPGDEFLLPRYWAKKGELADIRALTAAFERIDVLNHAKHTAYSVDQLRSARHEAKTVVDTYWVTDSGVQDLLDQLADLEAALVNITPLEHSLAAAAALDERHYKADRWSKLAAQVAAGKMLLTDTADPNAPVTSAEINSAAQAITDAIDKLEAAPPVITVGGLPVKDGQSLQAGTELTIDGERLEAGSMFRAELHSTPTLLGSVTVGPHGTAVLNVRIPASTPAGSHTLHVFGTSATGSAIHHTVSVTVAGAAGPSNLPRTGADLTPLYAGGGFMVAGALLVLIRRRYAVR